jgi:ATP-binding cassette subfamily B protein
MRTLFYQKISPIENEKISCHIRSLLYEKTKYLDLYCFEDSSFYDKYTRAMAEADSRASSVLFSVSGLASSIISLATLFFIIIYLDPILILFAILGAILSTLIEKRLAKIKYEYNMGKTSLDRTTGYIHRLFYEPQYVKDIKMDNIYGYFIHSYKKTVSDLLLYIKKRTDRIAFYELLSSVQTTVLQIAMIIFLTYRVYTNIISIGDYAALLNSTFSLMFQLKSFLGLIPQFYEHSLYIQNLKDIINQVPDIEREGGILLNETIPININFINVSFYYPNTDKPVLKNVNMIFTAGEKHAIVGHNGAGKSTIIKLILRLYDVTEGTILLNNINIKDYDIFSLRRCISTVFQDFQLYSIPIADYISSGESRDVNAEDQLCKSLHNVGLYEKIASYKKKMQTQISKEFDSDGIIMSGGDSQKIALAKACMKSGSLFVLDEPSSSLDPISEYNLHKTMLSIAKDTTVILISHRLSTTKDANVIYYIENGELVEKGNHDALMNNDGKYARMFKVQAEYYQLDTEVKNCL